MRLTKWVDGEVKENHDHDMGEREWKNTPKDTAPDTEETDESVDEIVAESFVQKGPEPEEESED